MALFKADAKSTNVNIGGKEYVLFVNSQKLFDRYAFMQIQSGQYFFTNCFEYINKVNLNSKYEVVYISDFALYFYIHDLKRDTLTAYNMMHICMLRTNLDWSYLLSLYQNQKLSKMIWL